MPPETKIETLTVVHKVGHLITVQRFKKFSILCKEKFINTTTSLYLYFYRICHVRLLWPSLYKSYTIGSYVVKITDELVNNLFSLFVL